MATGLIFITAVLLIISLVGLPSCQAHGFMFNPRSRGKDLGRADWEVAEGMTHKLMNAPTGSSSGNRRLAQAGKCDKCNIPLASGGCKCDSNCDCKVVSGKCDKCNIPAEVGGCQCDGNCDCKVGYAKCDKCNVALDRGGCKCDNNCDCRALEIRRITCPVMAALVNNGDLVTNGNGEVTKAQVVAAMRAVRIPEDILTAAANGNFDHLPGEK
eukprot:gene30525-35554_t